LENEDTDQTTCTKQSDSEQVSANEGSEVPNKESSHVDFEYVRFFVVASGNCSEAYTVKIGFLEHSLLLFFFNQTPGLLVLTRQTIAKLV